MSDSSPRRFAHALLAARLAPLYLGLGVAKHVVRVDRLARWAWCVPRVTRATRDERRLVSLVLRVGALAGRPDRDCLQRSLLLYRELSRAGADPQLVVGFRRVDGRVRGHAWVQCDGRPVTTETLGGAAFDATWTFGRGGRLVGSAPAGAVRAS